MEKREQIRFDSKGLNPDDWDEFTVVDDDTFSLDREKGYISHRTVVKRKADGKFFELLYTDYGDGASSLRGTPVRTLVEVFEKTKIITYYE